MTFADMKKKIPKYLLVEQANSFPWEVNKMTHKTNIFHILTFREFSTEAFGTCGIDASLPERWQKFFYFVILPLIMNSTFLLNSAE